MRYIYVDEAGIARNEPMTVVVGIMVRDTQQALAENALSALLSRMPDHQARATSSAKKVLNGLHWPNWERSQRERFVCDIAALPSQLNLPITISYVSRKARGEPRKTIPDEHFHQIKAFGLCIAQVDYFLRTYAGPEEMATIIAEDSSLKRRLRKAVEALRTTPFDALSEARSVPIVNSRRDIPPIDPLFRITRVTGPEFVSKTEGPLLKIADAVAFGARRYLRRKPLGYELATAIAGGRAQILQSLEELRDSDMSYGVQTIFGHLTVSSVSSWGPVVFNTGGLALVPSLTFGKPDDNGRF